PPPSACRPGSIAFSGPVIGSDATFQTMKMTPDATPITLATTMSTTRQRYCADVETVSLVLVTCRALSVSEIGTGLRELFASLRWHYPDQVRRSKLGSASSQPGSPDSRVRHPV